MCGGEIVLRCVHVASRKCVQQLRVNMVTCFVAVCVVGCGTFGEINFIRFEVDFLFSKFNLETSVISHANIIYSVAFR